MAKKMSLYDIERGFKKLSYREQLHLLVTAVIPGSSRDADTRAVKDVWNRGRMREKKDSSAHSARSNSSLNRFRKIWQKGGNPRLTILRIIMIRATPLNQDRVLRGTNAPANREIRFEVLDIEPENTMRTVHGGIDIRTKTGRVGTLVIDNNVWD